MIQPLTPVLELEQRLASLTGPDREALRRTAYRAWNDESRSDFPQADPRDVLDPAAREFVAETDPEKRTSVGAYLLAEEIIEQIRVTSKTGDAFAKAFAAVLQAAYDWPDVVAYFILLLATRHGKADQIAAFATSAAHSPFWLLYEPWMRALPQVDLSPDALQDLLGSLVDHIGKDWNVGALQSALEEIARSNPATALALVDKLRSDTSTSTATLSIPALIAGLFASGGPSRGTADELCRMLQKSGEPADRSLTTVILGYLAIRGAIDPAAVLESLSSLADDVDIGVAATALNQVVSICNSVPAASGAAASVLERFAADARPAILYVNARAAFLFAASEAPLKELSRRLLATTAKVPPDHAGTIAWSAQALIRIASDDPDECMRFLREWAVAHDAELDITHSTRFLHPLVTLIREHPRAVLAHALDWIVDGRKMLVQQARRILHDFVLYEGHLNEAAFREVLAGKDLRTLRLIANELGQGRLPAKEVSEALLAIAGLAAPDADFEQHLTGILRRHAEQYPRTARPLLEAAAAGDDGMRRRAAQATLDHIVAGVLAIEGMAVPAELRSSEQRLNDFYKAEQRKNAQIQVDVNAEDPGRTPLVSMMTHVPIGRGDRVLHRTETGWSKPQPLALIRHETEMPRLECLDPVGALYHRITLSLDSARIRGSVEEEP